MNWQAYWTALYIIVTALFLLLLGGWALLAMLFPSRPWVRIVAIIAVLFWAALLLVVSQGNVR